MSDPLQILIEKRQALGTKQVAADLGYSESTIRAICTDHYNGDPAKVFAEVMKVYVDVVQCPFIDEPIPAQSCRDRSHAPKPFGGSMRARWWEACQACPLKPKQEE
jgi:hypothetical protein